LIIVIICGAGVCFSQNDGNKCVGVDEVLKYLKLYQASKPSYPQSRVINRIKRYGFCTRPTESEFDNIKRSGGSPELISAIEEATRDAAAAVAVGPPPPPPAKPKEGVLRILCQPVDCHISVNGKPLGDSSNGEYSARLPVGLITVAAAREDYDVDQKMHNLEVKDGETVTAAFKMSVSRAALETAGARLFGRMIDALGGPDGLKSLGSIKAAGTLNCYDRGGQLTAWEFSALIKAPDKARFDITRTATKSKYETANTERGIEWSKTDEKSPQFLDLDLALRRLQEQQIARTIGGLRNGFKMVATTLNTKDGEDAVLMAEGGGQVYRITVGADMRPREILLESGGLEKGLKVRYAGYVERAGTAYPLQMEIQYPDAERHGVAVKLRSVDPIPPTAKDTDFVLKKKGKILGIL
jgi:hypothetical protein